MTESLLCADRDIESIYSRHVKTVYHVCFAFMKNSADTEDAVSETFCKMIQNKTVFESTEHEKAWLIRTASNVCKNVLKHWWRKNKSFDELAEFSNNENVNIDETLQTVINLPNKYKTVVYLYYYEGYSSVEIADILHKPQSTVRNYLHEARKILKNILGGDFNE